MELKDFFYPAIFIIIAFLLLNTTKLKRNSTNSTNEENGILKDLPKNYVDYVPKNSFVKPKHELLQLLSDISSSDKIYLKNIVEKKSYTNKTIDVDLNELVVMVLKKIISGINGISKKDFFIKEIEKIFLIKDDDDNIRVISDAYIYDISNHYTIRINVDYVIFKDEIYINMIDIDESAINNMLNNYDVKYQSQGILSKYMSVNDYESLLNNHYKDSGYNIIGVDKSTLDFDSTSLSGVFTLSQLSKNYLPSGTPNQSAPYLCKKNSDKFDSFGINFINDVKADCVANDNAITKQPNKPYNAPGVVTKRVDFNEYDWLKNPIANGNILYGQGFHL